MLPEFFEFQLPTKINYANHLAAECGMEIEKLTGSRAFIVTDAPLVAAGVVQKVIDGMQASSVEVVHVFDETPANSDTEVVCRGAEIAREKGCDIFVSVGGGSPIDTAKAIDLLFTLEGDLSDWEGVGVIDQPLAPHVAIPTTAGTGSEVTFAALVKDRSRNEKIIYQSPRLAPDLAILDPDLTVGMPGWLTAATGIDALVHAIEAYVSNERQPLADAMALWSIAQIGKNLERVMADPSNLALRGMMLVASTAAGAAFANALVGAVHACAHACGAHFDVHHGTANAILLPHVMAFNLPDAADRYFDIARALDLNVSGKSHEEAGTMAVEWIRRLIKNLGLPTRLSEVGVTKQGIPELAAYAMTDGGMFANPREAEEQEIEALLNRAF
ncbi:MAG: iron-containing alcohol dehydrogenase [Myxococcota bacterium]|nr:iron-containing alcohol dehydrogenase [Myxococcota bacterium]